MTNGKFLIFLFSLHSPIPIWFTTFPRRQYTNPSEKPRSFLRALAHG
jgi:hypothetical protein